MLCKQIVENVDGVGLELDLGFLDSLLALTLGLSLSLLLQLICGVLVTLLLDFCDN